MKIILGMLVLLALMLGASAKVTTTAVESKAGLQEASAEKRPGDRADMPLRSVSIKASNIHLALVEISDTYKVPAGLEVSPYDDLLKERGIVVRLESGTLRDVLNAVVAQHPLYTWEVVDGVVNVLPKGRREPVLKALLETRMGNFQVAPGTSRFTFRENLTGSPEVRGVLAAYALRSNNEIFVSRDMKALGLGSSLDLSDMSVRAVLNRVVRDNETSYWIVNRDGPKRQYLLLSL